MKKRMAYSYLRFSSKKQAKGGGYQRQLALTRKLCDRRGWRLDESLSKEDLGMSAFRGDNAVTGNLAAFLQAIENGQVPAGSALVVESLDRLSRNHVRKALRLFMGILDAGVSVATVEPEREYSPADADALSLFEPLLIFARAHEESATKAMRSAEAWKRRRLLAAKERKPAIVTCPCWLRCRKDRSGFTLIRDRADTVRLIFDLCIRGTGVWGIVQHLITKEIPPIGKSPEWTAHQVRHVLRNPAAMGTWQPLRDAKASDPAGCDPVPDYFPAVVDPETWRLVQARLNRYRHVRGRPGEGVATLFGGLLVDAASGRPMTVVRTASKAGKVYRYAVPTAGAGGRAERRRPGFPYQDMEDAILRAVVDASGGDIRGPLATQSVERAATAVELQRVENAIEEAKPRAACSRETVGPILDLLERLERQRLALRDELAELDAASKWGLAGAIHRSKTLIVDMATAEGQKRTDLRRGIKATIRDVLAEVRVSVERHGTGKVAHIQIRFRNGGKRSLTLTSSYGSSPPCVQPVSGTGIRRQRPAARRETGSGR